MGAKPTKASTAAGIATDTATTYLLRPNTTAAASASACVTDVGVVGVSAIDVGLISVGILELGFGFPCGIDIGIGMCNRRWRIRRKHNRRRPTRRRRIRDSCFVRERHFAEPRKLVSE